MFKRKLLALVFTSLLLVLCTAEGHSSQSTVVLQPVADTYANSMYVRFNVTSIYGTLSAMFIGNAYDPVIKVYGHGRAFIRFDLSAIPPEAKIVSAYLMLYMYFAPNRSTILDAYTVTANWVEKSLNWTNQPPTTDRITCTASVPQTSNTWISWDITDDAKVWHSKSAPNYGTMIRIREEVEAENQAAGFYSKEYVISEYCPRLELTYSLDDPAFNAGAPILIAGAVFAGFVLLLIGVRKFKPVS